jgi:hypothetical protein
MLMKDCEIFLTIINEFKIHRIHPLSWNKVEIQLKMAKIR